MKKKNPVFRKRLHYFDSSKKLKHKKREVCQFREFEKSGQNLLLFVLCFTIVFNLHYWMWKHLFTFD